MLATPQACVYKTLSVVTTGDGDLSKDANGQQYSVHTGPSLNYATNSSWIRTPSYSNRIYEIQVSVGWNDSGAATPFQHHVVLRSAVWR